jgi:CheY-like chemotaxis protein
MAKILLLVEDNKILLNMYQKFLANHGYDVHTAVDGEGGLKKAFEDRPDLILLDILMPKMDGISMLKQLRKDPWGENVPVIMLTNLNDSKSISDSMNENIVRYIVKSDNRPEEVLDVVEELLKFQERNTSSK